MSVLCWFCHIRLSFHNRRLFPQYHGVVVPFVIRVLVFSVRPEGMWCWCDSCPLFSDFNHQGFSLYRDRRREGTRIVHRHHALDWATCVGKTGRTCDLPGSDGDGRYRRTEFTRTAVRRRLWHASPSVSWVFGSWLAGFGRPDRAGEIGCRIPNLWSVSTSLRADGSRGLRTKRKSHEIPSIWPLCGQKRLALPPAHTTFLKSTW